MLLTVFGELERVLADLYPYRYVLTPLAAITLAGVAYGLVRLGLPRFVLAHRVPSAIVAVPLVVFGVVAGNYLLSPLWERSHLVEESPLMMASSAPPPAQPGSAATQPVAVPAFQPRATHAGMFKGADDFHFGRGAASLIATEPDKTVLRFENFAVRNGPDLYVYLSREAGVRRVDETLNLGKLKATDGAFNYELPPAIDVSTVKSVVVWCRQFGVLFAEAPLEKKA